MKRRIFIGIPATADVQAKADGFHYQHPDLPVRWIQPRNLHITLVPPFDLAQDLRPIIEKLKVVKCEPFNVDFDQVSFGPNLKNPRLIWAKGMTASSLIDLRTRLYEALGQRVDERPYRMHMTLARIRNHNPPLSPLILRGETKVDWQMLVDRFVLYESHLLPEGAEYEILAEFALKS